MQITLKPIKSYTAYYMLLQAANNAFTAGIITQRERDLLTATADIIIESAIMQSNKADILNTMRADLLPDTAPITTAQHNAQSAAHN